MAAALTCPSGAVNTRGAITLQFLLLLCATCKFSPGKYLCRVTSIASKRSNPNQTTKQPTSFVPWDIFNPSKQSGEVRFRESRSGTGTEWGNLEHAWTSKTVLAFNDFQHWDLHPELVRKEHKSSWLKHQLDFCMVRAVACNCTSDGRWFRSTYHTWVPALIILGHCLRDTFSTKSGQKPTQSGKQPVDVTISGEWKSLLGFSWDWWA